MARNLAQLESDYEQAIAQRAQAEAEHKASAARLHQAEEAELDALSRLEAARAPPRRVGLAEPVAG